MPNIQFNYRYRDSANYKKHGFVVFANPQNLSLEAVESIIKTRLIDGEFFYADEWNLPELFLETCDFRFDPTWHEFENIEFTNGPVSALSFTIQHLLNIPLASR